LNQLHAKNFQKQASAYFSPRFGPGTRIIGGGETQFVSVKDYKAIETKVDE